MFRMSSEFTHGTARLISGEPYTLEGVRTVRWRAHQNLLK